MFAYEISQDVRRHPLASLLNRDARHPLVSARRGPLHGATPPHPAHVRPHPGKPVALSESGDEIYLRILVDLEIYDFGWVSLEHLLLSRHPYLSLSLHKYLDITSKTELCSEVKAFPPAALLAASSLGTLSSLRDDERAGSPHGTWLT